MNNFFKLKAFKKGLNLRIETDPNTTKLHLNTDKYLLEGVLTNLINNAIKYTDVGYVEVGCRLENGNSVLFYVKDTGHGIEKERQLAIFDRFVQANLEHIRSIEGSGLGLSIVKGYVEKLKGSIWLDSQPGKGSIFYFSLPL